MVRIVCVGNRLVAADAAGPGVYDALATETLPFGVELTDAGLAGLDILRWIDGADRVILVDAVQGFAAPGEMVVLDARGAARQSVLSRDHSGGVMYALRALPHLDDSTPVVLVGIESPLTEESIREAAKICVKLAAMDVWEWPRCDGILCGECA